MGHCYYPLRDDEMTSVEIRYQLQDILEAPVEKGQEVGKVEIYLNKNLHFSEKIFTIDCVRRNSLWQKLYDVLAQW